jgi:hypothetical protein
VNENEEEIPSLLVHIPYKVTSYNLRDKSFKKLFDLVSLHKLDGEMLIIVWRLWLVCDGNIL